MRGWIHRRWRQLAQLKTKAFTFGAAIVFVTVIACAGLVAFGRFDRAAVVAGRTEVLSVRVSSATFGQWSLPRSQLLASEGPIAGRITLSAEPGSTVRFVRVGRGPLMIDISAAAGAPACASGGKRAGQVAVGEDVRHLCDTDTVVVPMTRETPPLTLGLEGDMVVGEAVRAGGGNQPILLEATALLLIRPAGGLINWACGTVASLRNICERYEVAGATLSTGDEAFWRSSEGNVVATGFMRLDPAEDAPGFRFDVAANASVLRVVRLKGEPFEIEEAIYDRVLRSPVAQTLAALGSSLAALAGLFGLARGREADPKSETSTTGKKE